jgi:hypothetical protein
MSVSEVNLSEDTYVKFIYIEGIHFDLHYYRGSYYICPLGKLDPICSLTEESYLKLFPGKN